MKIIADYHVHTALCAHATGTPVDYIRQARKAGLKILGFADHAPLLLRTKNRYTMYRRQLPLYRRLVRGAAAKFDDIRVVTGLEADYLPGYESRIRRMLAEYPYDFIIGSVHFIDGWAFDDPRLRQSWGCRSVDDVYLKYYDHLDRAAGSGLFDIMGHVDLVKKFGDRPSSDMAKRVRQTAGVFKRCGVAIEVNTSGLRKPVREIYPSLEALKIYCKAGVPITFGSDAHAWGEVGMDFDKACRHAKAAGYRRYVLFENRRRRFEPL
ncbi:MAG: histidinol-phosphatase HisJ family protein [Candidatus Omnitrophota bacterium]